MKTKELARNYEEYIISTRRHLHMHPELSMEEDRTTEYIASQLDEIGIPYVRLLDTGLVATLEGKAPGGCVALRADIDALNVTEANDVDYKSKHPGKMHACGHDAHAAMLLGAARILHDMRDEFPGRIHLVFQPGEEVGRGARALMEAGTWYEETESIFGAHIWSGMPSGTVSLEAGPRMAAADMFTIDIKGRSGHGSMPHQGVDAALIASAITLNLQALVSRETSPLEAVALSVGVIRAGVRWNILAGSARLEGTCRYFSKEIAGTIEEDMRRIAENTARAFRGEAVLEYHYLTPPLINDEESSELAALAAERIFPKENIIREAATTGGEDFSFYVQDKPGVFALIGCADPAKGTGYPHHAENFNIDEDVLSDGAALYAQYALDYLQSGIKSDVTD